MEERGASARFRPEPEARGGASAGEPKLLVQFSRPRTSGANPGGRDRHPRRLRSKPKTPRVSLLRAGPGPPPRAPRARPSRAPGEGEGGPGRACLSQNGRGGAVVVVVAVVACGGGGGGGGVRWFSVALIFGGGVPGPEGRSPRTRPEGRAPRAFLPRGKRFPADTEASSPHPGAV